MTEFLEIAWDEGGLFALIRAGRFDANEGIKFLRALETIDIDDNAFLPKRFVSLLWYLPNFLEWQRERIGAANENLVSYEHFITETRNWLEKILGTP